MTVCDPARSSLTLVCRALRNSFVPHAVEPAIREILKSIGHASIDHVDDAFDSQRGFCDVRRDDYLPMTFRRRFECCTLLVGRTCAVQRTDGQQDTGAAVVLS